MAWPKRLKGAPKQNAEKTHCKWGHEFTEQNTIWKNAPTASGKMRVCRKCKADRDKTRRRVTADRGARSAEVSERNKLAEFYDAELANVTGLLFDALNEIQRLKAERLKLDKRIRTTEPGSANASGALRRRGWCTGPRG